MHGQIILNSFKQFPRKAVQTCGLVAGLTERMQQRRHSKLFLSKRKITSAGRAGRKLNPMRDRTVASRPKPMTATATTLVHDVWMDYFAASGLAGDGASKGAPLLRVVQPGGPYTMK